MSMVPSSDRPVTVSRGEPDDETVFVDGTKLESCAGRYTFRWRGSIEKQLSGIQSKVAETAGAKNLSELTKT